MTSHISAHPQIKAVILVGGDSVGTRFRPLAMDCVKPLFPIAGNATIYHHVQALVKVPGMTEIFLVGFYEQHVFDRFLMEVTKTNIDSDRVSVHPNQVSARIPAHGHSRRCPSL